MENLSLIIFMIGFSWWFYNIIEMFRSLWYVIILKLYKSRMLRDFRDMDLDEFLETYPEEAPNFL